MSLPFPLTFFPFFLPLLFCLDLPINISNAFFGFSLYFASSFCIRYLVDIFLLSILCENYLSSLSLPDFSTNLLFISG